MKIILEAKDIPIGSSVRKELNPFSTYILINDIHVVADGHKFSNRAHPDCLFIMVPHNIGSLEVIKPTDKFEWIIKTLSDIEFFSNYMKEMKKCVHLKMTKK